MWRSIFPLILVVFSFSTLAFQATDSLAQVCCPIQKKLDHTTNISEEIVLPSNQCNDYLHLLPEEEINWLEKQNQVEIEATVDSQIKPAPAAMPLDPELSEFDVDPAFECMYSEDAHFVNAKSSPADEIEADFFPPMPFNAYEIYNIHHGFHYDCFGYEEDLSHRPMVAAVKPAPAIKDDSQFAENNEMLFDLAKALELVRQFKTDYVRESARNDEPCDFLPTQLIEKSLRVAFDGLADIHNRAASFAQATESFTLFAFVKTEIAIEDHLITDRLAKAWNDAKEAYQVRIGNQKERSKDFSIRLLDILNDSMPRTTFINIPSEFIWNSIR